MKVHTDVEAEAEIAPGMFPGRSAHGLQRQLRVHIGIALTIVPSATWNLVNARFDTMRTAAREELIERIVKGLAAFDIRWKGDLSNDPDPLPPWMRAGLENDADEG